MGWSGLAWLGWGGVGEITHQKNTKEQNKYKVRLLKVAMLSRIIIVISITILSLEPFSHLDFSSVLDNSSSEELEEVSPSAK